MLHDFSRRKAASARCRAGFESRGLLPENAVRHLKLASCFPKIPPSISKSPTTSPKCCTASQGGRLLPRNATLHFKVARCFPEMLRGPPDFPLSTLCLRALYQV